MRPDPVWQLIGTVWPLVGLALIAVAGSVTRGATRWWIIVAGPLIVAAPCFLYAKEIAYDGNMLFVLIFVLFAIGLMVYYPVLAVVWIVRRVRRTQV